MKLTQLMKENEERPLSNEVKRHFLEIVSTYNKYQESMDRKSDITQVAETLGGITEAARTLAIKEAGDWFDKHTVKRNMSELDKLGKQFDKVALEARALDQRMAGLYEDMGHILSRYYKFGEITEDEMKNRLGINEAKAKAKGYKPKDAFGARIIKAIDNNIVASDVQDLKREGDDNAKILEKGKAFLDMAQNGIKAAFKFKYEIHPDVDFPMRQTRGSNYFWFKSREDMEKYLKKFMSDLKKLSKMIDIFMKKPTLKAQQAIVNNWRREIMVSSNKTGGMAYGIMKSADSGQSIYKESNESKKDCGCGCGGTTPGGCGDSINEAKVDTILKRIKSAYDKSKNKKLDIKKLKDQLKTYKKLGASDKKDQIKAGEMFLKSIGKSINEQPVTVHNRTSNGNIVTVLRESDLNEEEMKLYEFGKKVTRLMEKSCPNDPGKWAASKAAAKKKFDVYPSAYANGWAAKNYKGKGGTWKNC